MWPDTTFLPGQPAGELIKLQKWKQEEVICISVFILMFGGGHRTSVGLSYTESRHDNVDIYHLFLWIVTIKCENFPNNFIGFHNLFINVEIILKVIGASYTDFSEGNMLPSPKFCQQPKSMSRTFIKLKQTYFDILPLCNLQMTFIMWRDQKLSGSHSDSYSLQHGTEQTLQNYVQHDIYQGRIKWWVGFFLFLIRSTKP